MFDEKSEGLEESVDEPIGKNVKRTGFDHSDMIDQRPSKYAPDWT